MTVPQWAFEELNKAAEIVGLSSPSQVVAMLTRQCLPIWLQQQQGIYSNLQESTAVQPPNAVDRPTSSPPDRTTTEHLQQSTAHNSKAPETTAKVDFLQALEDS
ncbi:MAG: hypothetical protein F6K36_29795 [Symploca sp. SIO3C6]|nr:hypothetical protein [Symploca sp. SIO3C6]